MPGQHLTKETQRAIHALSRGGCSIRKTASILGIGEKTVERYVAEARQSGGSCFPKRDGTPRSERETQLERIIDLSAERLVDELEGNKKIPPTVLNVIMGTAWDKRYAKPEMTVSAQNLVMQLFGGNQQILNVLQPTAQDQTRRAMVVSPSSGEDRTHAKEQEDPP